MSEIEFVTASLMFDKVAKQIRKQKTEQMKLHWNAAVHDLVK